MRRSPLLLAALLASGAALAQAPTVTLTLDQLDQLVRAEIAAAAAADAQDRAKREQANAAKVYAIIRGASNRCRHGRPLT